MLAPPGEQDHSYLCSQPQTPKNLVYVLEDEGSLRAKTLGEVYASVVAVLGPHLSLGSKRTLESSLEEAEVADLNRAHLDKSLRNSCQAWKPPASCPHYTSSRTSVTPICLSAQHRLG